MIVEMVASLFGHQEMDERFILHRYKSTRIAMVVGVVMLVGWFTYEMMANDVARWDLFLIVMAMAATKVAAMIYFRIAH